MCASSKMTAAAFLSLPPTLTLKWRVAMNVLVLGRGVSGLTTALKLLEAGYQVVVWAKEAPGDFAPTSLNAYACWTPVRMENDSRIERWAFETLTDFELLANVSNSGVTLKPVFDLKTTIEEPWYANRLQCFHATDEITSSYRDVHVIEQAPVIDPTLYLPWLQSQVAAKGGCFVQRQVDNLFDCPNEFDVIINCTSLGARQLCNDKDLCPLMLQYVTIKNRDFDRVVMDSDGPNQLAHIVPHADRIIIGTTYDEGSESMTVDETMTTGIIRRCSRIAPGFTVSPSDIVSVKRCVRPKRSGIRVEPEQLSDGRWVIHNYGGDGKTFIVSHGVADEICGYLNQLS